MRSRGLWGKARYLHYLPSHQYNMMAVTLGYTKQSQKHSRQTLEANKGASVHKCFTKSGLKSTALMEYSDQTRQLISTWNAFIYPISQSPVSTGAFHTTQLCNKLTAAVSISKSLWAPHRILKLAWGARLSPLCLKQQASSCLSWKCGYWIF